MTFPLSSVSGDIRIGYVAWLDIVGDPVRACTLGSDLTFSGTGDADLDGFTFLALAAELVEISPVTHGKAGSDSVTATLFGIPGNDDTLLTQLALRTSWQGRTARLWMLLMNADGSVAAVYPYYTGYMMKPTLSGDPVQGQRVTMTIENYLALFSTARGRTYQDQATFDAADVSPARIRASANGVTGAGLTGGDSLSSSVGGGRGGFGDAQNVRQL